MPPLLGFDPWTVCIFLMVLNAITCVCVYCETEYFESKECHGKIRTMSLITSFTFSVPIVKATGLSFSFVRRYTCSEQQEVHVFAQFLFCSNVRRHASSEISF